MSIMEETIKCLEKIKIGDISSSVKEVESFLKKNKNQEDVAIKILLQTSFSITSGNLQDFTTTRDVFKISWACCNYLERDFRHDKVKYLSALHHILKYLIQKGDLVDASKLINYLFVVKDNKVMDDAVANIFYATYYCFRSSLMEELQHTQEVQSLLIILKDTVNILMYCGNKYLSIIVDHAVLFLKFIESKNFNSNFNELFDHTLDILDSYLTSNHIASNVNCKTTIKCANIFLQLALKCLEFDNYKFVCKIVSVLVCSDNNFMNESVEADCFELFRLTLSTFASDQKFSKEQLKRFSNKLVIVISKYGSHELVENVCVSITLILSAVHKKWLKWTSSEWISQWDLTNIGHFHKIIISVIKALGCLRFRKSNMTEEEAEDSNLKIVAYTVLLQLIILSTSRCYLSNCSEIPEKLVLSALDAFIESVKSITELKTRKFSSWTSYWTNIVFEVLKISQELTNHEQWIVSQKFYAALCKTFVNFEDTILQEYSFENSKLNAFIGYIKASLSLKEYEKALHVCAVALVLLPGHKKKLFDYWGNAKLSGIADGCFELEQYSLLNLFKEETYACFSEFPSLKWDIAIIEEYFIAELEYYSKYGVGMFNLLYAVSKDCLKRLSNSIWNARGTDILLEAACSQEDVKILQTCSSMGKETLRILKCKHVSTNVEKFKLLVILGNLHYKIFLIDLIMLQIEQKERIEYIESTAPKVEPKDDKDLYDDVYKVTSEYENLTIENEAKLVHQLNTAVHYWLQLLDLGKYADIDYLKMVIANIENVAYSYGLFGCVTHEINVWGLYYKLNCILGSDTGKLQAISFILRLGNFESKHLLEEFEGFAQSLKVDDKCKAQQISLYCHYLLGKSWMSLKNFQLEMGIIDLIEVKNLIGKSSKYEHKLLLAECYYLLSKYLSISDWKVPPELENELSLSCGYTALWILKYLVGEKRRSAVLRTRLLYITLKLVEWLTEMHIALKWNAEIFNILKELLVTCQMAVLPIRSSQILAFMAEIRLLERDVNDCKSKMMCLEKILNLKSYKLADDALKELKNNVQKLKVLSTDRADSIFQKHVKLVNFNLDKDVRNKLICSKRPLKFNDWSNVTSGSPDFRNKVPKVYRAMSHQDDCRCYLCQNLAGHAVVIHYYSIIAIFTELVQCVENIIPTYEAGLLSSLCLYEKEAKQIATVNKTFTEVTGFNITFSEIQDQFKIYCTKYISIFSDFLASYKVFTEASDLNTEAICFQETVKGPKTFYLRDTYIVKYRLTISQLCYSETIGNNYEETLRILLDEKVVAKFKKLGEHLRTPQLKIKYDDNLSTPRKDHSFLKECNKVGSIKSCNKNEDHIHSKMKQLVFDSSSDSEGELVHKDIPVIIITEPSVPKGTILNKNNPEIPSKSMKKKKKNFSVYVSPSEDKKLTRNNANLDSLTIAKIKDQNNDPDFCEYIKKTTKNKLRPNTQRKGKKASYQSQVGNKQKKTTSLIFESSEEEIEQSTDNTKLNSFRDCSSTNNKTPTVNLRIFDSSSDEETFPIRSANDTKIENSNQTKFVKVYTNNMVQNKDKSDSQKLIVNQKNSEESNTIREKVCTSKRKGPLKSKECVPRNETSTSQMSELTNKKTSKSDIKLPENNLVKGKVMSISGTSEAKERPSRRVTRKNI